MKRRGPLHYIRIWQLKQLIPPLLYFVCVFFILRAFPLLDYFNLDAVSGTEPLTQSVNVRSAFIRTEAHDLYYTGSDYYVNGKLTGHFYYEISENYCRFYILKAEAGKSASKYISVRLVNGKLIKYGVQESSIIDTLANELCCTREALTGICDPYLVSEVAFLPVYRKVLLYIIVITFIPAALIFLYLLFVTVFPQLSKACRRLKHYKGSALLFREADSEFRKNRLLTQGNMILTPRFLFEFSGRTCAIIPLESVLWVFDIQELKFSMKDRRPKMFYTLRIVTIAGDVFMLKDKRKKDLTKIMDLLTERYPNFFYGYSEEHDKIVHYILAENKKEKKESRRGNPSFDDNDATKKMY